MFGRTNNLSRWLVLLLGTAMAACAHGPPLDAKGNFERGRVKFNLGEFDDAIEAFSNAYELDPRPGFLFNIGKCHVETGNLEKALFFFEGYLREKPKAANRKAVEILMTETRSKLAKNAGKSL